MAQRITPQRVIIKTKEGECYIVHDVNINITIDGAGKVGVDIEKPEDNFEEFKHVIPDFDSEGQIDFGKEVEDE